MKKNRIRGWYIALAIAVAMTLLSIGVQDGFAQAFDDTLWTKDGQFMSGELLGYDGKIFTFKTSSGVVSVPKGKVMMVVIGGVGQLGGDMTSVPQERVEPTPPEAPAEHLPIGAFSASPANAGIVVYYPFNSNANDASGNGNHARVNGATLIGDRFGNPNSAYRFDGRDDYLEISRPLSIFSDSFTVSMWVKVPSDASGRVGILIGDYGISNGTGINFEINSHGQIRFYWNSAPDLYGKKDLRDNQWHHLFFVRDKENGRFSGYVDGAVDILWEGKIKDRNASVSHRIGRDSRTGDTAFDGIIDDIRIYSRALNPEEELQGRP